MANIFEAMGYSLGKVHTGAFRYLVQLFNEGEQGYLRDLLKSINEGIDIIPEDTYEIEARLEYKNVDLVLFDSRDDEMPLLAIEMKVDDHEHKVNLKKRYDDLSLDLSDEKYYQTYVYKKRLGVKEPSRFFFVTLGIGEIYYRPMNESGVTWVILEKLEAALNPSDDLFLNQWKSVLKKELIYRKGSRETYGFKPIDFEWGRQGCAEIYYFHNIFMNVLDEELAKYIDVSAYLHGSRPDTIVNLGWKYAPFYIELNNNCKLNLKLVLEDFSCDVNQVIEMYQELFRNIPGYEENNKGKLGKTKTFGRFDIGLKGYGEPVDLDFVIDEIRRVLIDIFSYKERLIELQRYTK